MNLYEKYSLDELLQMPLHEEMFDRILEILELQCRDLLSQRAAALTLSTK